MPEWMITPSRHLSCIAGQSPIPYLPVAQPGLSIDINVFPWRSDRGGVRARVQG